MTADILLLADILCAKACEMCNQQDPAEAWVRGSTIVDMGAAPLWAFEDLADAANAYYEARRAESRVRGEDAIILDVPDRQAK